MNKLLRGLPAQLFLATLLPLTVIVAVVSFGSIAMHQATMRQLVSERDMRTVMATASMLQDRLENSPNSQLNLTQADFSALINPMAEQWQVTAFLVDADGRAVFHTDGGLAGTDLSAHGGVAEALRGEHGVLYRTDSPGGKEHMIAYAPIAGGTNRLGLVIEEPWQDVIDPIMQYSLIGPLIMLPVLLISAIAIMLGVNRIVRPLQRLQQQARQASLGQLTAWAQPVGGIEEIEHLQGTLNSMAQQIDRDEARLRGYAQAVTEAQEQERQRLARELHDDTIQNLIVLSQRIQQAKLAPNADPAALKARFDDMRAHVLRMIEDVRRFSRALHPIYLEAAGLADALERMTGEAGERAAKQAPESEVRFQLSGSLARLKPDVELMLFRIAQEGVNNALKHAHATLVIVQLRAGAAGTLELSIQDNGIGYESDLPSEGFGLTGIRERAALIGARVVMESADPGTRILVSVDMTSSLR